LKAPGFKHRTYQVKKPAVSSLCFFKIFSLYRYDVVFALQGVNFFRNLIGEGTKGAGAGAGAAGAAGGAARGR
jgi:hypothetical protein